MTIAETVAPLVRAAVSPEVPVKIRCWDGSRSGPASAQWQLNLVNRRGLRRLLWAPNELGFARAYVAGDIDIEGDLLGVAERVQIRVQDYRDVHDGPFDAIASIGMAEHVGVAHLPTYAAQLYALLRPHGRLLNHAISRRPGKRAGFSKTSFIDRYVFADGEIEPMATMIEALEWGFDAMLTL